MQPIKTLSPKQYQAATWWSQPHTAKYDAIICSGAVRSGKTFAMSLGFVTWAMLRFSKESFAFCGKSITSVRRNLVTPLIDLLHANGFIVKDYVSKNYLEVSCMGRTNRFYLFGGKDEGSAAFIQGITLAGVFFDEVALMPRSFVEQAIARCSVTGGKLWFNCNPDHPYHWFYLEWIQKFREKNALYLHFTMADNPSLSREIRARYERFYTGAFYERYILGNWVAASGVIYPMFSLQKHCFTEEPICEEYWISCDYGTVNPTSFGLWGRKDGISYRIREYYYDARRLQHCRTDEEHYQELEHLAEGYLIKGIILDPSAASFAACIRRHGKFRVIPANNDVMAGIQQVSELLLQEKLKFHSSCTDTLREFQCYCWNESYAGDAPKKEQDHAMDDIRYYVSTLTLAQNANQICAITTERR